MRSTTRWRTSRRTWRYSNEIRGFLLDLVALYEKSGESPAADHPELQRQICRIAAEFDLAYVRENMGKVILSTRQGVKRVADIVQNLRGFARLTAPRSTRLTSTRRYPRRSKCSAGGWIDMGSQSRIIRASYLSWPARLHSSIRFF